MNEPIIITKGNHGIELIVDFIDSKKKPVDITGCTVEVTFINPGGVQDEDVNAVITNYISGQASVILDNELTNIEGLWKSYWSAIKDDTGYVTAQEAIYYFVLPQFGGAN